MSKPKISLLCPSYNHERFVGFFIDSVLKQTVQNWELIIVDDCSTDNNVAEIQKYKDPRIKLLKHDYNQGINAGLNDAFELAQGEYCVFIASDDILMPNHLESAIGYLEAHSKIDVFYCSLLLINEKNGLIPDDDGLYVIKQQGRYELLEHLFLSWNCLASPGMVVRYVALQGIMPLPLGILQHQDAKIHAELLLAGDGYQSSEQLVQYRRLEGDQNASAHTLLVHQRCCLEEPYLLDSFLKIKDVGLLKSIFKDRLVPLGLPVEASIPYFLGRLALTSECPEKKAWGYNVVMRFYETKENQRLLYDLYGFSFKNYLSLAESSDFRCGREQRLLRQYEYRTCQLKKYRKSLKIAMLFIVLLVFSLIAQVFDIC